MHDLLFIWCFFQSINPPISAFGKLCQISEIYKTGRGDLVSKLPFLTNAFTSTGRYTGAGIVYTVHTHIVCLREHVSKLTSGTLSNVRSSL